MRQLLSLHRQFSGSLLRESRILFAHSPTPQTGESAALKKSSAQPQKKGVLGKIASLFVKEKKGLTDGPNVHAGIRG